MLKISNRCYPILSAAAILGAISACATLPENPAENQVEPVVAKTEWLKNVQDSLSANLCADDQLFRSCFSISENECRDRVLEVATNCEFEYQGDIPEALSDHQGKRWGGQIGQCTGEALYEVLDANYAYNETDRCKEFMNQM